MTYQVAGYTFTTFQAAVAFCATQGLDQSVIRNSRR
jgi:hypothetical protein